MEDKRIIKEKNIVIIQRGNYLKACRTIKDRPQKFGRHGEGQLSINLGGGIGHMFGTSFKMVKAEKKVYNLEIPEEIAESIDLDTESGYDNRDICDDGQSQALSKADIKQLVDSGKSGDEVIQTLAQNSKTFKSKTKYSQEKYVTKKQRKYDEVVTLHQPSIRLLAHMYYTQDPLKISNLRIDSLSQMMSYINVQPGGSYAVYEAGLQGLITASMLNRIGSNGSLVHVYSGANPHREAVELMDFSYEELVSLSYIGTDNLPDISISKSGDEDMNCNQTINGTDTDGENVEKSTSNNNENVLSNQKQRKFVRTRVEDIERSTKVLSDGVTGIAVACRQHPSSITLALLSYLRPGHSFAVFSPYKEPLMDLFMDMKTESCLNIRLAENWLRNYQVLPERTHPEINMSGGGGYILTGWKVGK